MEQTLLVTPQISLDLWRAEEKFKATSNVMRWLADQGIHQKATSKVIAMQREYAKEIQQLVSLVDESIKQNLGLDTVMWGIVPDICTVYVTDEVRTDTGFVPPLRTKNSYTYQALCEILLESPIPKTVLFMLSENCNLKCSYCFEKHEYQGALSFENCKKLIDQLFEDKQLQNYLDFNNSRAIVLEFMGGEPLLYADLIGEVCDYFYASCIKHGKWDWLLYHQFNITTNGTLYFKDDVQWLLHRHPDLSLAISIDGTKECHDLFRKYKDDTGSFDDTLAAVKREQQLGRLRMPKMTFNSSTIKYMTENVKFMAELGYPAISITPALEKCYTAEDGVAYYEELLKIADFLVDNDVSESFFDPFNLAVATERPKTEPFCGGEGGMLTIMPDGSYRTCHRMTGSDSQLVIGTATGGFAANSEQRMALQYVRENGIFARKWPDRCDGCLFKGSCVGCPAITLEKTGSLEGDVCVNGCYLTLARFAAAIYYQAKRFGYLKQKYVKQHRDLFLEFLPLTEVETLIEIEEACS